MLGCHHVIGAAERLARDHGDKGDGGLRIGKQQLRAVRDQCTVFLVRARQESGHVHESHDRNAERVAEAHEARGLARGIDIENPGEHHGLVRDEAHGAPGDAAKAGDDVFRECLLQLEEIAFIGDFEDELLDVIGLVRIVRNERVERFFLLLDVVVRGPFGHTGLVVGGKKVEQPAHLQQAFDVVVVGAVGDAGLRRVHRGAAELLRRDYFVGHGLHHVGTGDEHVAGFAHHENEIRHGRRIDVAARAWSHDDGNLRNDAGGDHVALEHLAVAAERGDAFLDARAAGVE